MGYRRRKIEEGKNPRVTERRGRSSLNVSDVDKRPMQHKENKGGKTVMSSEAHWSWRTLEVMASTRDFAPNER